MSSLEGGQLLLTMEEIRAIAADVKEDLQRQANLRVFERKIWEQGIGSLASMEAILSTTARCGPVSSLRNVRNSGSGY
jgi:hypothetical protein